MIHSVQCSGEPIKPSVPGTSRERPADRLRCPERRAQRALALRFPGLLALALRAGEISGHERRTVMTSTYRATLDELVELLRDIKPGLGDTPIEPGQSVVEDLGLDSLDLLQLSRKITRQFG